MFSIVCVVFSSFLVCVCVCVLLMRRTALSRSFCFIRRVYQQYKMLPSSLLLNKHLKKIYIPTLPSHTHTPQSNIYKKNKHTEEVVLL